MARPWTCTELETPLRIDTHTDTGPVQACITGRGGSITVHADHATDRAYVELTPAVEGDETAQERITQAEITSDGQRFTVRLPNPPAMVINGGGSTVIQGNGGVTVVQSCGTVTGTVIGAQVTGNNIVVAGGVAVAAGGAVNVAVFVPAASSVMARSSGGDIITSGLLSSVDADTSGGDVEIGTALGDVDLRTSGGTIFTGIVDGRIDARTSGGDVCASEVRGGGALRTSGGNVSAYVTGPRKLSARTSGGDIRLDTSGEATEQHLAWRTSGGRAVINGCVRGPRGADV